MARSPAVASATTTPRKNVGSKKSPRTAPTQERGRPQKRVPDARERSSSPASDNSDAPRDRTPSPPPKPVAAAKSALRPKYHHHEVPRKSVAVKVVSRTTAGGQPSMEKRKHRWRSGTVALREIKRLQRSPKAAIPLSEFVRCVRHVLGNISTNGSPIRLTKRSSLLLREMAERDVVAWAQRLQCLAATSKRVSPTKRDVVTERRLRQNPSALLHPIDM